jgi:hypothetical protein
VGRSRRGRCTCLGEYAVGGARLGGRRDICEKVAVASRSGGSGR